jgi:hypothetical protein
MIRLELVALAHFPEEIEGVDGAEGPELHQPMLRHPVDDTAADGQMSQHPQTTDRAALRVRVSA